jgi:hypothetical protein
VKAPRGSLTPIFEAKLNFAANDANDANVETIRYLVAPFASLAAHFFIVALPDKKDG